MTTIAETRRVIASFLVARQDPRADAIQLMHETFTFTSPLMRFTDREVYLQSHRDFQRLVRGTGMISELYGNDEATLLSDLETATPAGVQRTAEHLKLVAGRVGRILLVFDSAPWNPLMEHVLGGTG